MGKNRAGALVVEVTRGGRVESAHEVHAAVCNAEGAVVRVWGDPGRFAFLRSSAKPLQALPLVASGAADAHGLSEEELAIACGSHSAEAYHLAAVRSLLGRAGLEESLLQCGAHQPISQPDADALVRAGDPPRPIHSNCSGKHAGMLALARHLGAPPETYLQPEHPVQRAIRTQLAELAGLPEDAIVLATDGCGVPTFGLPLCAAATAFARLAAPPPGAAYAGAAHRVTAAMRAHPEGVAGTGRFDTVLMRSLPGRLFCKSGAEGYFCAGLPASGLGLALKVTDGSGRPIPAAAMYVLNALRALPAPLPAELESWAHPVVTNTRGERVGEIRVKVDDPG